MRQLNLVWIYGLRLTPWSPLFLFLYFSHPSSHKLGFPVKRREKKGDQVRLQILSNPSPGVENRGFYFQIRFSCHAWSGLDTDLHKSYRWCWD